MTNWIKLHKHDNWVGIIAGHLGTPNSFAWAGEDQFHAWLDIDTLNWIAVYAEAENEVIDEGQGIVRAYVYLAAASETPLTFGRRFRASFVDNRAANTFNGVSFETALASVTADVVKAFNLPM